MSTQPAESLPQELEETIPEPLDISMEIGQMISKLEDAVAQEVSGTPDVYGSEDPEQRAIQLGRAKAFFKMASILTELSEILPAIHREPSKGDLIMFPHSIGKEKRGIITDRLITFFKTHIDQPASYKELAPYAYPDSDLTPKELADKTSMTITQSKRLKKELAKEGLATERYRDPQDPRRVLVVCLPIEQVDYHKMKPEKVSSIRSEPRQAPRRLISRRPLVRKNVARVVISTQPDGGESLIRPDAESKFVPKRSFAESEPKERPIRRLAKFQWEPQLRNNVIKAYKILEDKLFIARSQDGSEVLRARVTNKDFLKALLEGGFISQEELEHEEVNAPAAVAAILIQTASGRLLHKEWEAAVEVIEDEISFQQTWAIYEAS